MVLRSIVVRVLLVLLTLLGGCQPQTAPRPEPTKLTLIVFSAKWCGPCQRAAPVVDKIARVIRVERYDVDRDTAAVEHYGISVVPTFIMSGRYTHDINAVLQWLASHGITVR